MGLLPEDPRNQYRLLGIILTIAVGSLWYFYLFRPQTVGLLELEDRIGEIEFQNETAEARMENLEAVRRELQLGERQYAMLERLVPTRGEVPAIYEAIASESQSLGLELTSVVPTLPQPDSTGSFLLQNWEMEVEGEYHDVGAFLARVASFDRIVRPEVEEIRPSRETNAGRQLVSARFDLETFVLPGGSERTEEGSDGS